jgi:hypothetical protein
MPVAQPVRSPAAARESSTPHVEHPNLAFASPLFALVGYVLLVFVYVPAVPWLMVLKQRRVHARAH